MRSVGAEEEGRFPLCPSSLQTADHRACSFYGCLREQESWILTFEEAIIAWAFKNFRRVS